MVVSLRLNGALAQAIGASRLRLSVAAPATVATVVQALQLQYPAAADALGQAIPFVAGRHLDTTAELRPNQELALLMPAAGG